ncbi:hypothetical protein [Oscillibacter sp.]|uniref:hypothetical protein n=1 Tax=Oscillibacter sp. TaxID=1945593 RepID=UPI00258D94D8|nr:hypothetical protein [Oscillibacter sp.]
MMGAGKRHDLLTRAVKTYGKDAQMDMAVEEMAELTKALCKVKRAAPGCETAAAVSNVFEEIADVQIMLDQLRIIFGGSTIDLEDGKLDRLKRRLDRHDGIDYNNEEGWRGSMLRTFLNRPGGERRD